FLGVHVSDGFGSALDIVNPFELWKFLIVLVGLSVSRKVTWGVAIVAQFIVHLIEAIATYILLSNF
ncbi:MAG: hypothetical protein ACRD63_08005, partial [Pyrinomonadaceae bacterium]